MQFFSLNRFALLILPCFLWSSQNAEAANGHWGTNTGTLNWSDSTNWVSGIIPGATTGTTNGDTAFFDTNTAATTVTIDSGRNVLNLTFDGTTAAGTYTIGSAGANGGPALTLSSGGTLSMASGETAPITINAPLLLEGNYTIANNALTGATTTVLMRIGGNISNGTSSAITLSLKGTVSTRSDQVANVNTISGVISDGTAGGTLALNVAGTSVNGGAWYLTGLNTYTGATTVSSGVLYFNSIANGGTASAIGAGSTITLGNGVFFIYNGVAASTDRTISSAGATFTNNGGTLTLNGAISDTTGLILRGNSNFIINSVISGAGGVTRTDSGTVFFNNTNTFAGNISISTGTFSFGIIADKGVNSAIGAGSTISLGQNQASVPVGEISFTGASGGESNRDIILVNGTMSPTTGSGGILENTVAGQTLTLSGRITAAVATSPSTLTVQGAGNGVISNEIGGTSDSDTTTTIAMTLTKLGTGTWTLSGANNYSGLTTVSAGILNVQNNTGLGTTAAGTTVASGATLQLQGGITIGAEALTLNGTGATGQTGALANEGGTNNFGGVITLGANTTISSDSGTLNLTNTAAFVGASKALTLAGAGNGSVSANLDTTISSLTKTGTGVWTLAGTDTYTGATTVSAGTLSITGSLGNSAVTIQNTGTLNVIGSTGTGAITVLNGGELAGTGVINGAATVQNGGALYGGNSVLAGGQGTLTFNNSLTLSAASQLDFTLGTSSSQIAVPVGALSLDGVVNVTAGTSFGSSSTYTLFTYGNTASFKNFGLELGVVPGGYNYTIDASSTPGSVLLDVTQTGLQFWNGSTLSPTGSVVGGNGTWNNVAANTNWTDPTGSTSSPWSAGMTAVFTSTPGTVQVADTVSVSGLQFTSNYSLVDAGGGVGKISISNAATEIRVDANVTATISAQITGSGGINKTNPGTLVISTPSGVNNYTGNTQISNGTLKIGATNALSTSTTLIVGSGAGTTGSLDMTSASQTVAGLQVTSNSTVATDTITIGAGQTLTVSGTSDIQIGVFNSFKNQTLATFTGGGALILNSPGNTFYAGLQTITANNPLADQPFDTPTNANTTTTDMTGLSSFSATVNQFLVGYGVNDNSTLSLSNTSNTITASGVQIANSNNFNSGTGVLILGAGTNVINTDALNIGTSKGVGTIKFLSQTSGSAGTVTIDGHLTGGPTIIVGSTQGTSTAGSPTGTLDLRGHVANITARSLTIGKRDASGAGGATGTVYFDGGTFTTSSVDIGDMSGNSTGTASGTLNISNGTFTVSGGSFTLATFNNTNTSGVVTGTVNLTGGTLDSSVPIVEGAGTNSTTTNTVGTLNLNGGTLNMNGNDIGSDIAPINNIILASGTLENTGEINGGGAISKTTTGTLIMQGDNEYSGTTTVSAGTLLANNDYTSSSSATGSNSVTVSSGATLGGNGRIAGPVTINSGATLAPGGNATTIAANVSGLNTAAGTLKIDNTLNVTSGANVALALQTGGTHGLSVTFDPTTGMLTSVSGTSTDGGNGRIIVTGAFTLDTNSTITVTLAPGYTPSYHDVFDLLDWTTVNGGSTIPLAYYGDASGQRTGADDSLYNLKLPDITSLGAGYYWDVSQFGTSGVISVVPEPSRVLLLLTGFSALLLRRRRTA